MFDTLALLQARELDRTLIRGINAVLFNSDEVCTLFGSTIIVAGVGRIDLEVLAAVFDSIRQTQVPGPGDVDPEAITFEMRANWLLDDVLPLPLTGDFLRELTNRALAYVKER